MKIQQLFDQLEVHSQGSESLFDESCMVNRYKELDYGFFPLGSGILSEKSKIADAEIEEGGIMVLGNDFGTISYVEEKCKNKRENKNNSTIRNLLRLPFLDKNKTYFTNFHLGLRNGENDGMTSSKIHIEEYSRFCYEFFVKQLEFVKPKIVICLGKPVNDALLSFHSDIFPAFKNKAVQSVETQDFVLGHRTFLLIPHPSLAHFNWKEPFLSELKHKMESTKI